MRVVSVEHRAGCWMRNRRPRRAAFRGRESAPDGAAAQRLPEPRGRRRPRAGSRLFELRAAASLARLLVEAGRRHEGKELLGRIYSWFTEGFEAADLKEARALLSELA